MSFNLNLISLNQFKESCASELTGLKKTGKKRWRLVLSSDSDDLTKVATCISFASIIYFLDRFLSLFGIKRKWVLINVISDKGKKKSVLLNINSVCARTIFTRDSLLSKSADDLSKLFKVYKKAPSKLPPPPPLPVPTPNVPKQPPEISFRNFDKESGIMDHQLYNNSYPMYRICLPSNESLFFKKADHAFKSRSVDLSIAAEAAGSSLANYLTGNLVPKAYPAIFKGQKGTYQNFITLKEQQAINFQTSTETSNVSDPQNALGIVNSTPTTQKETLQKKLNFSSLTPVQISQLICHILADRIISNWDTHQYQYAISADTDSLFSFDKAHSFVYFLKENPDKEGNIKTEDITSLLSEKNIWFGNETSHYISVPEAFFLEFKQKKIAIKIDEILQKFFKRCKDLSEEQLENHIGTYAAMTNPENTNLFKKIILNRTHDVERAFCSYIGHPPIISSSNPFWKV